MSSWAAGAGVLAIEAERAVVERLERGIGRMPAAARADVHRDCLGTNIVRHPACLQPAAEIGVFPVQEEPLVESTDRVERLSPDAHAGAGYPVDLDRLRRPPGRAPGRLCRESGIPRQRLA